MPRLSAVSMSHSSLNVSLGGAYLVMRPLLYQIYTMMYWSVSYATFVAYDTEIFIVFKKRDTPFAV